MGVTVKLPSTLRRFAFNLDQVTVENANTVLDALKRVVEEHPRLHSRLFANDGQFFSFVSVFVNSQDIRNLQREATPVKAGDTITLIPAIAGG